MSKVTREWLDLDLQLQLTGMQSDIIGLSGAVYNLQLGLSGAEADIAGLTGAVNALEQRMTGAEASILGLTGAVYNIQTYLTNLTASQVAFLPVTGLPATDVQSAIETINSEIYGFSGGVGFTGLKGDTGEQGVTGLIGITGIQGVTGLPGGATGLPGATGIRGVTGLPGVGGTGLPGVSGSTGPQGMTGSQGNTGIPGLNTAAVYNTVSRYSGYTGAGEEVLILSSSSVYTTLSWTRSSTTLTINRSSHGHTPGNRVVVRNTNVDYQEAIIATAALNSFTITTTSSGGTSGSYGAYSLGFTFQHDGDPKTGGTLSAPTGDHADVQLLSIRIRTGPRDGSTYDLVVPASAINGAGANTFMGDCFIPDFNIRVDGDSLSAVSATMVTNYLGISYSTFRFGNLGTLPRIIIAHF